MKDKPTVGSLVVLCPEQVREAESEGLGIVWEDYVGKAGIVTNCVGIRCHVEWSNGQSSWPRRIALKVLA